MAPPGAAERARAGGCFLALRISDGLTAGAGGTRLRGDLHKVRQCIGKSKCSYLLNQHHRRQAEV